MEDSIIKKSINVIFCYCNCLRSCFLPEEVTHINGVQVTIEDIDVITPAFDITPAELIHKVITEKGIAKYPYKKSLQEQHNVI